MDTAIGAKCAPPYACIFMDKVEAGFLESKKHKPVLWVFCIDEIYFIWTHGEKELEQCLKELNKTNSNLKFTHWSRKEKISFFDYLTI